MAHQSHTLKSYDEELNQVRALISKMGGFAEAQLTGAVEALMSRDTEMAHRIVAADRKLDEMESDTEALAIEIIARRGPVADDLRELISAIKIATMLERIGDYAKNIAKRTTVLAQSAPLKAIAIIPQMTREAQQMIRLVMDACVERDHERAVDVWVRDERVDALYNSLFRELLTYMMEEPKLITPCTHLLFIAKNIERVGDQATNIAELVFYMVEGVHMGERRPKKDDTSYTMVKGDNTQDGEAQ